LFSEIVIKLEPKRDFLTSAAAASNGDLLPWLFESVIERFAQIIAVDSTDKIAILDVSLPSLP